MANHVVIAIPAYTWTVQIGTMRSLIHDIIQLIQRGDRVTMLDESGSSDICDARSVMVAQFLETDGTHLVNVDNDVMWPRGTLLRLVDYPVDCVAAVYPKREDPISFPVRYLDRKELRADPETGLLEVAAVQGGFVRYSRAMIERMVDAYRDELTYRSTRYKGAQEDLVGLFERILVDGRKLGEDFAFFHRWLAIGGKVWVQPEVMMGHIGPKAFMGSFGQWLRSR